MVRPALAALCLFFGFGSLQGQTVVFHLRNGDRLTGTLLSEDASSVTLSNVLLGRVTLPLAQVQRREALPNIAAAVTAARSMATNAPAGGTKAPTTVAAQARRLNELLTAYVAGKLSADDYHRQRAAVLAELGTNALPARLTPPPGLVQKPAAPKHWSGEVQMGADLGYNQNERQLYTGRMKFGYAFAPVRHSFDYLATYGRADNQLTANRMDGSLKTDYDLKQSYYLYSLAGAGYDEIRKIDWRYEVGPGVGYRLVALTNFVLRLESGFHYEVHNFENNQQRDVYYQRLAQDLKWNLGTLISLDEKVEYLPELDTLREYKLRMEANVRLWLRSNLYLNLTVINLYDTVTAPGVGQNDLQVKSSVGVRF